MHGLINRAFQSFLEVNYGPKVWEEVVSQTDLPFDDFQAMLIYPDAMTLQCFESAVHILQRPPGALLEDLGTFLITHEPFNPVRRLLRFGGADFPDFLLSLEELGERGRLVMPDLDMPEIRVEQNGAQNFNIAARWRLPGIGALLLGALRAMADDYGALALVSLAGITDGWEHLTITMHLADHSAGRAFTLSEVGP